MSPLKNKRLRQALLNYIISLLDKPGLLKTLKNEQLITRRAISTGICSCFSILIILMGHPAFRHFSTDITSSLVNTSNFFQELNSASSNQNLELAMKLLKPVPTTVLTKMKRSSAIHFSYCLLYYPKYCINTSQCF